MRIAVAGGTGLVGQLVVEQLVAAGLDAVTLARSTGVDLVTGAGLDAALAGADAVIDVSNTQTLNRRGAVAFFETGTRHLLAAGARAGVRHHLVLSIVGSDRVNWGYYEGKQTQERLLQSGAVPWTILRCTQFHEFAHQLLARSAGPIAVVPRMRIQPIAAREVAAALVEQIQAPEGGLVPDLAGPHEEEVVDLARQVLKHRGSHRRVVPVTLPGGAGRKMADGALLPTSGGTRGTQTFAQWLSVQWS